MSADNQIETAVKVTPQMAAAGEDVLLSHYFDLCDVVEYPVIARTVYDAMEAARLSSDRENLQNRE